MLRLLLPIQHVVLILWIASLFTTTTTRAQDATTLDTIAQGQCRAVKKSSRQFAKQVYNVGVLGNRGLETLYQEYNSTFAAYLTETAGRQFDPPIRFEIFPLLFGEDGILDKTLDATLVDFTFMNPALYSCIESEGNANSLLTFINKRTVNGTVYAMSQFGGVVFVHQNNTSVNTVKDIEGKRVATTSVTSLGSGQMQFQLLQRAGLHHFQSPRQLIMMESQARVVDAVILGEVDVGYVRTDQLERSKDPRTGELLDLSELRIVASQEGALLDTGEVFPVALSTPLFPEWNFASFPHVPYSVMQEAQAALMSMKKHAALAGPLTECYNVTNCNQFDAITQGFEKSHCEYECFVNLDSLVQDCTIETFPSTSLLAAQAMDDASCAGWIPSLSYMSIRNMQEETGFITTTLEPGVDQVRCTRTTELVDAVVCPPGHFRKPDDEIITACESMGMDCYGYQCLCSPCVKAYDVDFFPVYSYSNAEEEQHDHDHNNNNNNTAPTMGSGCSKLSICGQVIQGEELMFELIDNQKRFDANFTATLLESQGVDQVYPMTPTPGRNLTTVVSRHFHLYATDMSLGTVIVKVEVDGVQIPESPFRVVVVSPACTNGLVPAASGECICPSGTFSFGFIHNKCWKLAVLVPILFFGFLLFLIIAACLWQKEKNKKMDSVWRVERSELKFDDPPRFLGEGSFGMVLAAEYRGTIVAIKQVVPPRAGLNRGSLVMKGSGDNMDPMDKMENGSVAKPTVEDYGRRSVTHYDDFRSGTRGSVNNTRNSMTTGTGLRALRKDFIREMRTLSKLRHPCIVSIMGAVVEPNKVPILVMEYMELGSLYELLQNSSMVLEGETMLPMLQDICSGVRFLHSAKPPIVHGDIKSQNVLVDARFRAKVADFGLTTTRTGHQKGATVVTGTPLWMAPELLRKETENTTESDIWAFGITLSEILSRKDPFDGEKTAAVIKALANPLIDKVPTLPQGCYREAVDLMNACLKKDPASRLRAKEIDLCVQKMSADNFRSGGNRKSIRKSMVPSRKSAIYKDLLSQLFPEHVAEALREGRTVEPENHACVTVYFSDIVNYTTISSTLSPGKVSDLLHRLYTKFDDLCEEFDLFKVETVGDAYMVATLNSSNTPDNHVALIARFAFGAIEAASDTLIDEEDPDRGYVQIRCGFHSGPVVTHVVGHRNPRFSVIGDTVNTASRMESNSEPGRVNTSKVSADLLMKQYPEVQLESRGNMAIKGKGQMHLFWVRPPEDTVNL